MNQQDEGGQVVSKSFDYSVSFGNAPLPDEENKIPRPFISVLETSAKSFKRAVHRVDWGLKAFARLPWIKPCHGVTCYESRWRTFFVCFLFAKELFTPSGFTFKVVYFMFFFAHTQWKARVYSMVGGISGEPSSWKRKSVVNSFISLSGKHLCWGILYTLCALMGPEIVLIAMSMGKLEAPWARVDIVLEDFLTFGFWRPFCGLLLPTI